MNMISLRAKGVEPFTAQPAILHGWRLRFNVQHFFRHEGGVGNVEPSSNANDRVLGMLYQCADETLESLDAMEAYGHGYDRIEIPVQTGSGLVQAYTYVGMPEFINNQCLPTRRYLNLLIAGATQAGLDPGYIARLEAHPTHQPQHYPTFQLPDTDVPVFTATTLAEQPLFTGLNGAVFDMADARPLHHYLKSFFGGRDMTLFHIKRLDSSSGNESMDDIRHGRFNQAQRDYLNSYLHEYAREYRYVGRFDYN